MEVLVRVFDNEALAELWAGILRNEGVRSVVKPVAGSFPLPYHGPFIPHGLYVLPDDEERAKAVLEENGQATAG